VADKPVVNLKPHPLVTAIGARLGVGSAADRSGAPVSDRESGASWWSSAKADTIADALAGDSHAPELVTFAGFLGGKVDDKGVSWRVLYRDTKLRTWLLVPDSDIVFRHTLRDDRMPFREHDEIWLRRETAVTEGSGPLQDGEIQARQLRGAFTAASDVGPALTGDAGPASDSGVYCGGGCTRRSFV
jgi:hypothetical protein